uniref:uncharacterized protein LOC101465549 n=1 Tax=Maylandia zebra TaxID=106582 RepID=UPI000D2FD5A0|nr:uncharacterized protein LOC101465549 [Maylandia zebra]
MIHKGTSGSSLRRVIVVTVIIAAAVAFIIYTYKKVLEFFAVIVATLFVAIMFKLLAAVVVKMYGRGRGKMPPTCQNSAPHLWGALHTFIITAPEHREQRRRDSKKDTAKLQLIGNGSSKTIQARPGKCTALVRCVVL